MDIRKTTVMISKDVYQVNLSKEEAQEFVDVIGKLESALFTSTNINIDVDILKDMATDLKMNLDILF